MTACPPEYISITMDTMEAQMPEAGEEGQPASRLELLPRELRDRIYFYLGFPVARRCLHYCDKPCTGYTEFRGNAQYVYRLERSKLQALLRVGRLSRREYREWEKEQAARLDLRESLAEYKDECQLLHAVSAALGASRMSGRDEDGIKHSNFPAPKCGLFFANRFFYDDMSSCFRIASTIDRDQRKQARLQRKFHVP
ncbi:hypothetical protein BU26DRAFT_572685 [Trematosphaeria pertusa]|uniref:Uncharacterized protein n=1 Tax=Trematosphaeria pertusa TaxID=390896 RepID=A0A6A6HST4_9PLEO|nr:uncharacterized protein BU26DRAFT_572685 [Trematosphaeria pertusa]KAF2240500.1 hypothetical protein BU26DRAFT_572685 [Trematosphaeria pertusa]